MTSDTLVNCLSSDAHNTSISGIDILDLLTAADAAEENYETDQSFLEQRTTSPPKTGNIQKEQNDEMPSLSIAITNVVAMANMRCHLKLKEIARTSINVEYKALQNHVIMRLRHPYTVATIWSSGKIWCTGANSISKARAGARRIARRLSKVGFPCKFSNFRIVNIMATCKLPFKVRLDQIVKEKPLLMSYEPELAPGLNYKLSKDSSTSLKLFSTGRIILMGNSIESISSLVSSMVPMAAKHQTDEPVSDAEDDIFKGNSRKALRAARLSSFPEMPEEVIAAELDDKFIVYEGASSDEEDDRFRRCRNDDSDEFCHDYVTEEDLAFINDGEIESAPESEEENDSFYSGASEDSEGRSKNRRKKRKKKHKKKHRRNHDKSADPTLSTFTRIEPRAIPSTLPSVNSGSIKVFSTAKSISALDHESKRALSSGSSKLAKIVTYNDNNSEIAPSLNTKNILIKQSNTIPRLLSTQNQTQTLVNTPNSLSLNPQKKFIPPNGLSLINNPPRNNQVIRAQSVSSPNLVTLDPNRRIVVPTQLGKSSIVRIPVNRVNPVKIINDTNPCSSQKIITIPSNSNNPSLVTPRRSANLQNSATNNKKNIITIFSQNRLTNAYQQKEK